MMGLIVSELYDALIEAGASPDSAKAAAAAVPSAEEMATKDDFARLEANFARLEANMVTKDDFAKLQVTVKEDFARFQVTVKEDFNNFQTAADKKFAKLEKQIAVLRYAVFTGVPAVLAFMVKLTFFP